MNIYVYDDFLADIRYKKVLDRIEIRITDLGLNGRIIRLGAMKNAESAVQRELSQGVKAIVAVGDDLTINKILNAIANFDQTHLPGGDVPIFIIPIKGRINTIARKLGIPDEEEAGDVLSARLVEKVNLGLINNRYFLSEINVECRHATLEIDENFSLEISSLSELTVANLPWQSESSPVVRCDPRDQKLELLIKPKSRWPFGPSEKNCQPSIFSFQNLLIKHADADLFVDHSYSLKAPAKISLANKSISLIVGKKRIF